MGISGKSGEDGCGLAIKWPPRTKGVQRSREGDLFQRQRRRKEGKGKEKGKRKKIHWESDLEGGRQVERYIKKEGGNGTSRKARGHQGWCKGGG